MPFEELRLAELGTDKVADVVVVINDEEEERTHSFIVIKPADKPECAMRLQQPDGTTHFEQSVSLEGSIPVDEKDLSRADGVLKTGEFAVIQGLTDRYGRAAIHHPISEIRVHKKAQEV